MLNLKKFKNQEELKNLIEVIEELKRQNYFVKSDFRMLEIACYLVDSFYSKLREKKLYLSTSRKTITELELQELDAKIKVYQELKSDCESQAEILKCDAKILELEKLKKIKTEGLKYEYFYFDRNGDFKENKSMLLDENIKTISGILEKVGLSSVIRVKIEGMLQNRVTSDETLTDIISRIIVEDEKQNRLKNN